MIRKIYTLLILGLCLGFAACGDDNDGLDPNAAAPVINFPMEQLDVDLNKVDNLPVVAVIKSQARASERDNEIADGGGSDRI